MPAQGTQHIRTLEGNILTLEIPTPSDEFPSVSTERLVLVKVGPVHVKWDDVGIGSSPGVFICDLPYNAIVMNVLVVPTVDWGASQDTTFIEMLAEVGCYDGNWASTQAPGIGAYDVFDCPAVKTDGTHFAVPALSRGSAPHDGVMPVYVTPDIGLPVGVLVRMNVDGTPSHVSAGEADVFVIIAQIAE